MNTNETQTPDHLADKETKHTPKNISTWGVFLVVILLFIGTSAFFIIIGIALLAIFLGVKFLLRKNWVVDKFFADDVPKQIFDNIKNLATAAIVCLAGLHLFQIPAPTSAYSALSVPLGIALSITGFTLVSICVLDGCYRITKNAKTKMMIIISRAICLLYVSTTSLLFSTIIDQNHATKTALELLHRIL